MTTSEGWITVDLDLQRNTAAIQKFVAQSFVRNHGDHAIMMAMAEMLSDKGAMQADHWRKIINLIEEIQNGNE
jgi:hypothetical protein